MDQNSQASNNPDTSAVSAYVHHSSTHPQPLAGVIVVIPAFNEELAIGSVILKTRQIVERVIVVDDGSSDRTSEVAKLAGAEVIRIPENSGKANAELIGLKHARDFGCKAAVTLDGDGQHSSGDIPAVVQPVLDGNADLVIGSRSQGQNKNIPAYRQVGQKGLDLFTNIGSQVHITDSQSGLRALSPKALANLDFMSQGFNIESDMIVQFADKGLMIKEVPISVRYDVPHMHKKNPFSHGGEVLVRLIGLISYRRPLPAFGIPGFILFIVGLVASSYAFAEYYLTTKFPFTLSMMGGISLILGLLLIITGLILNAIVILLPKK
jgi:glycosyltransferase involved in cell wall biosynthesis